MNELERAAETLLSQPVPDALNVDSVSRRAHGIRRRQRLLSSAAVVAVVLVFGSAAFAARRASISSVGTAGNPPTSGANEHVHRFRFVGQGDDQTRQMTMNRVVNRYRMLGFDATAVSVSDRDFEVTDTIPDGSVDKPDAVAEAVAIRASTAMVGVDSRGIDPCDPPALPQYDAISGALVQCYTTTDEHTVDPGDQPLVRSAAPSNTSAGASTTTIVAAAPTSTTTVAIGSPAPSTAEPTTTLMASKVPASSEPSLPATAPDRSGHGLIDVQLDPTFASGLVPLEAGCAQPSDACRGGKIVLVWDGTVMSTVNVLGDPKDGHIQINGYFDESQARVLSVLLRSGRLPVAIELLAGASVDAGGNTSLADNGGQSRPLPIRPGSPRPSSTTTPRGTSIPSTSTTTTSQLGSSTTTSSSTTSTVPSASTTSTPSSSTTTMLTPKSTTTVGP